MNTENKENNVKPWTKVELVTTILSTVALILSGATFYVQFFYVSESITAATVHLEITKNQRSGSIVLAVALVNGGNRDALIPGCTLTSDRLTFDLEKPTETQMTLKPGEIKPQTFRGTFSISGNAMNGTAPIYLVCETVGARGLTLRSQRPIGTLEIENAAVVLDNLFPLPVRLK